MTNKPYTHTPYTSPDYAVSEYNSGEYSQARYTGVNYNEEEFDCGAEVKDTLLGKINRKDAVVAVIGLGYVGLPLAVHFAQSGFSTLGVDISEPLVEQLKTGCSHVLDISDELLSDGISKALTFSADYQTLQSADCVLIAVPTPLTKTKEPDISCITDALGKIIPFVRKGSLLILESTTWPGTTEELVAEQIQTHTGLTVGTDVFIAFSPERVDPGNQKWMLKNTPKVIGGVTPSCTEVAKALYGRVLDKVHVVKSAREAEMVKLLENTFRAVNIGMANEFLLMCNRMNIDVWSVIEAASTKPFGFMPFYPGPGIGGHCIPLDPTYLSWKARTVHFYNRFIEIATDINGNMPRCVVRRLSNILNRQEKCLKNRRIAVLGVAYKKNVTDTRESPGLEVMALLKAREAITCYMDPLIPSLDDDEVSITFDDLSDMDAAILVTDHDMFDYSAIANTGVTILDCRNAFGKRGIENAHIENL
jgi:UDP-N-acetyl-D-glucosamine dehydrogenase